ncbi:MAG: DUF6130 family protein [Nostoc sp.]|uniref:DUF6130 family protein n=1 Tax=Nostoc sp. TaxID=1180 RepID=UPI002FF9AAD6
MNTHTPSARDIIGPSPLIAIENEAPPKLIVDPPLPEPLAQGRVFIQYRTQNLRVLPVFGKALTRWIVFGATAQNFYLVVRRSSSS